ncbi:Lysophospholipase L1 [Parageobacillus thermantarcticus]|uniref:Lysophospholipase L1 n=1 Tax=Parageobacillus thermantarcticus TaxID=186116 RepID=A0A1I0SL42_9BACL|nr:SGNH/GDSL hydrolase family protein [Parageobacillus thermantarcticus]SFA40202.1 Lysophospholipase L1 [Parageobacillus thermantarcticus]
MKKWGLLFLLLLYCAGCSSRQTINIESLPEREVKLAPRTVADDFFPKDIRLLALGDSLTEGVGDHEQKGGYVSRLRQRFLQHKGVRTLSVINLGKRGLRLSQLDPIVAKNLDEVRKADLIFITIGGNDIMKIVRSHFFDLSYTLFAKEQKRFAKRLDHLLATIRATNRDATIVLVGLYNPFSSSLPNIPEIDDVIELWNNGSKAVLARYDRTIFVNVKDLFDGRDDVLYSDQFHPNEVGYELIARRVYEQLEQHEQMWLGRLEE